MLLSWRNDKQEEKDSDEESLEKNIIEEVAANISKDNLLKPSGELLPVEDTNDSTPVEFPTNPDHLYHNILLSNEEIQYEDSMKAHNLYVEKKWTKSLPFQEKLYPNKSKLKKLIRMGIPAKYRSDVWYYLLNIDKNKSNIPNLYQTYIRQNKVPLETQKQIELDIPRTFVNLSSIQKATYHSILRQVLLAFASHYPSLGYCQGLNFIASVFIFIFYDSSKDQATIEETVFWSMVSLLGSNGLDICEYYNDGMRLLKIDMLIFWRLLRKHQKTIYNVLCSNDISPLFFSHWFITLFANSLSIHTLVRVWDLLLYEGKKILYRVGIILCRRIVVCVLYESPSKGRRTNREEGRGGGKQKMGIRDQQDYHESLIHAIYNIPKLQIEHDPFISDLFSQIKNFSRADIIKQTHKIIHYIQDKISHFS